MLYWTAFVYHIVIGDEISMLATSLPMLMNYAKSAGLDPLAIGMVWTFSAGGKIFLYQSAVLVVGYSYGYFTARDLFKVGAALTIVEWLILMLLVPLYWPLIGILAPSETSSSAWSNSSLVWRTVRPQRRSPVGASSQRASGP